MIFLQSGYNLVCADFQACNLECIRDTQTRDTYDIAEVDIALEITETLEGLAKPNTSSKQGHWEDKQAPPRPNHPRPALRAEPTLFVRCALFRPEMGQPSLPKASDEQSAA